MDFTGTIIEESLWDRVVLNNLNVVETVVEDVDERHQTPWLEQWTKHSVIIPELEAEAMAERISDFLEPDHAWYADFKNDETHFIIFKNKVFKVNLDNPVEYQAVKEYGLSLGIPDYQLDFDKT